ncbi:MAG: porphobilinogen synthase [Alphaproteobacteria bacterium]|nr:porphobilinogen synthase [Alphaproteobacteria bacterium]MCD8526522.1 porphobilinogen synthase [Alphaproteobacteria bacterium]MCD8570619.1 porphobilinogen synthase [Alphaproteobacteria bacterium]
MISNTHFPSARLRRLRSSEAMRALVQENTLSVNDFILPIFVEEDAAERSAISSLPGVFRETEATLPAAVKEAADLGIKAIILFGVSKHKDFTGSDSMKPGGLLARMIKIAKNASPETLVIADTCFCEYTDHGHCGPLAHGDVDNDATLENLGKQAVVAANAGADIIAPSGMMDGMVGAIRRALDSEGHTGTPILSYAVKYASAFYGPFRDAAGCTLGQYEDAPKTRKTYQMNPANGDEGMREAALDVAEGADMLMVKPGLPYLDMIRRLKDAFHMPVFAYHVSGEFAMLKAAAANGWLDYDTCLMESLMSFKRAGCDAILTYGAKDAARILRNA